MNFEQTRKTIRKYRFLRKKAFGKEGHKFRVNSKLSTESIKALEDQHGISFPEDYRDFLINVGDGGAGPGYGLLPLGESIEKATEDIDCGLSEAFRYSDFYNPAEEENFHLRESEKGYWDSFLVGSMPICHEGCGYYHLLIVSGENAGSIWLNGMSSDMGLTPLCDSFNEWYTNWLMSLSRGQNGVWW